MMAVIGMTQVLLARMVSGRTWRSISANSFCLSAEVFQHRFDHIVGVAHGFAEIGAGPHVVDGAFIFAEIAQVGGDARPGGVERRSVRVRDGHPMTGEREDLGNAVAHEAGADDGDFSVAHDLGLVYRAGPRACQTGGS